MINNISGNNPAISYRLFAFYCCILVFGKIIAAGAGYNNNVFSIRISKDLNFEVMDKSLSLTLQDYEDSETYDSLKRAMDEKQRPSEIFILIISALGSTTTFFSYVTVLTAWKWYLLPLFLVTPVFSFFFIFKLGRYEFKVNQERTAEFRRVNYYSSILNNDISFKENKILDICNYLLTQYKEKYDSFVKKDTYIARKQSSQQLLFRIIESVIGCFVIAMIIHSAIQGMIMIGTVYAYITAI